MLALLIAIATGVVVGLLVRLGFDTTGWAIFFGLLAMIGASFLLNRIFGRRLKALVNLVQANLQESQQEAYKLLNRFQSKPMGSAKLMQDKIEQVVEVGVRKSLGLLDTAQPLYKWNLMAERSVATLKFQLHYQIKEFEQADALMGRILVMDPMTMAMKMARLYKQDASPETLEKLYRKGIKKFKYEKGVLIYGLYAWILLRQEKHAEALEVLDQAKQKTEDETLTRNWQQVANGKFTAFSLAGLGEQWYALHLDKPPKQKAASKGQMKNNPMMPKGKRRFF